MKPSISWTIPCCLFLLAPAIADEVRLHDGRVLVGSVKASKDSIEVTTVDGVVRVARDAVAQHRTTAVLREELRELGKRVGDTTFARLQLAIQARDWGLEPELWKLLDELAAQPIDDERGRERLREFLAQLEPQLLNRRYRQADTGVRVRELLAGHRDRAPGRRAALVELLAREPNSDATLRQQARKNQDPERRLLAVEALQRQGGKGADSFLWRTAVIDPKSDVRERSLALVRDLGQAEAAVQYLAPGLEHTTATVRVRTAEAFGGLGVPAAMEMLVRAAPNATRGLRAAAGEDGIRGHIAITQQQSYIRDFDVEVASASFIADPQIDVLQSGIVLDVNVQATMTERVTILRAYRRALDRLARNDPGEDPRLWPTWLSKQPKPAAAPTTNAK